MVDYPDKLISLVDDGLRRHGFHLTRWTKGDCCYLVQEVDDLRTYLIIFIRLKDFVVQLDLRLPKELNMIQTHEDLPDGRRVLELSVCCARRGVEHALYHIVAMLNESAPILDRLARIGDE